MPRGGYRPGAGLKKGAKIVRRGVITKVKRELMAMAKDHGPAALRTLVNIAKNPKSTDAARVSAAAAILDRGYGKPAMFTTINPGAPPRKASEMTNDELSRSLDAVRDLIAARDASGAAAPSGAAPGGSGKLN